MAQMISCSICLTDLVENAKKGHSAFTRASSNGKVYVNLLQWLNEEEDKFKNHASFQLNSDKDKRDVELAANAGKKIYVGNGRIMSSGGGGEAVAAGSVKEDLTDLPF